MSPYARWLSSARTALIWCSASLNLLGLTADPTQRPMVNGLSPHNAGFSWRISSAAQTKAAARWNCCEVRRRRV